MFALKKLLRFLRAHWFCAAIAPICMVGEVLLDLMQPRMVQRIIDQGIARHDIGVVIQTVPIMAGMLVVGLFCGAGCSFFAVRAAFGMGGDLREELFRKVQTLSFSDLDRIETGALMTRLTSDVNQVQEMVMMLLRGMVRMPLLLAGSLLMAAVTSPRLGLIFVVILPVMVMALTIIIGKTFPLYRQVQSSLDRLNTVLQENLAGVRVVRAFARAAHESERFARVNDALIMRMTDAVRMSARTTPMMMLTLNTGVVAALWIGGGQVLVGGMRIGEVVAFINYLMQAIMSLMMFSNLIIQLSRAQASALRVVELLEREPALWEPPPVPRASRPEGRIAFENVSFSYSPTGHDPVLKEISFVAEPGETVAILGATGAGKSSLVQLIPRFYDVSAGRVTLDGVDVRQIPGEELRRHVTIALQESILFSSTIRSNISLGEPDASLERVTEAARLAQADDFVRHLPHGYDTTVGQRGVDLSGGQKQRLAIGRALLPDSPVLILDDSTSAVDVRTEARIREALEGQDARQTRLIVAQRISSVLRADKILVLDDGELAGAGTHTELLASCAVYREIYASQIENGMVIQGVH